MEDVYFMDMILIRGDRRRMTHSKYSFYSLNFITTLAMFLACHAPRLDFDPAQRPSPVTQPNTRPPSSDQYDRQAEASLPLCSCEAPHGETNLVAS